MHQMQRQLRLAAAAALALFAANTAGAQDTSSHKPGGLNKVARNVSKTFKKAGSDTKAELKRGSSKAHNTLTDAGNDTKKTLKKVTGIEAPQSHQPGGLNKMAREVSKASKKVGSNAKHEKNKVKSEVHGALSETGKSVKDTTLKGKP
jgi:hypothetical protein